MALIHMISITFEFIFNNYNWYMNNVSKESKIQENRNNKDKRELNERRMVELKQ